MEIVEKLIQITKYLDKNYIVKENKFFTKYDDVHEWGIRIVDSLVIIFTFDEEYCSDVFKHWAYGWEMSSKSFNQAWGMRKLKTTWTPEMAMDLQAYGVIDAEAELTAVLSQQIADEIDSQILRDLRSSIKTSKEFISLVRCVGYELTDTVIDSYSFKPKKYFVSMNYNDIKNERQNNSYWKDWIQSREQIKKT